MAEARQSENSETSKRRRHRNAFDDGPATDGQTRSDSADALTIRNLHAKFIIGRHFPLRKNRYD
jgi:hypothetical protein